MIHVREPTPDDADAVAPMKSRLHHAVLAELPKSHRRRVEEALEARSVESASRFGESTIAGTRASDSKLAAAS